MQGINPLIMKCTYITPCGWCTRQNKECDIEEAKKRNKKYGDLFKSPTIINKICQSDEDHQWECYGIGTGGTTYICKICGKYKTEPIWNQENTTISTYYNAETDRSCSECYYEGYNMPHCEDCDESNNFKHFEGWENI